jgi:hypothetical protein
LQHPIGEERADTTAGHDIAGSELAVIVRVKFGIVEAHNRPFLKSVKILGLI